MSADLADSGYGSCIALLSRQQNPGWSRSLELGAFKTESQSRDTQDAEHAVQGIGAC